MNLFRRKKTVPEESAVPPTIYDLAKRIERFDEVAHPSELLSSMLDASTRVTASRDELFTFALGENARVASLAILTLGRRGEREAVDFLLEQINSFAGVWSKYFALEALHRLIPTPQPLLGRVLIRLSDDWFDGYDRHLLQFLREHVRRRAVGGEPATFDGALARGDVHSLSDMGSLLDKIDAAVAAPLRAELVSFEARQTNVAFLKTVGKILEDDAASAGLVEHECLTEAAVLIEQTLTAERRRSVLVVGEDGVGKTTAIRAAAQRLRAGGWIVFEASASEMLAGQSYIGELENRMNWLLKTLRAPRRVAWIIPRFHELHQAGQHRHSESGLLDMILPEIDGGQLTVIGEISAGAHQKLVEQKRRVATAFVTLRLEALPEAPTLDLARKWAEAQRVALPEALLTEAWQLTTQYLGMRAAPGNLLGLLELTVNRLRAAGEGSEAAPAMTLTVDDLLVTLSQLTGLPNSILDDRQGLDLAALRQRFSERVLGQPEAVDVLVDRVAMIKAGVTDPTRPLGVFLFAGPTGTGKTEIAKTLSEYLFGSAERMIRIDMSELTTAESLGRLLGDGDSQTVSLVDSIRKQPFSVILLDEFEKSHPRVWDLFLQLFDDGRLTDRGGVTADFRHALIIMTSNIGAAIQSGSRAGFSDSGASSGNAPVLKAIEREFRKEFVNRIDRVVVFRPLTRETMRGILEREMESVFRRRGLRNRAWAVEWEEEAIDVLLADGFTTDLGARPLKRAVERKLLAPLAEKIVSRQTPAGDQSLFIRAVGGEVKIEFLASANRRR